MVRRIGLGVNDRNGAVRADLNPRNRFPLRPFPSPVSLNHRPQARLLPHPAPRRPQRDPAVPCTRNSSSPSPSFSGAALFAVAPTPGADTPGSPAPYNPKIAPASDEWMQAQKRIQVPDGFKVDLFAAEPMVANPVCFAVDEKNRFYVAETFRLHAGVTDIRSHTDWLDDDLACRTVDDRVAMMQRKLGDHFKDYGVQHDRIRLLEDTTGDGRADKATVFADGFHNPEDGIGAGLVTRNGDVWYTCIPDLWKLRDAKGTGKADERERLHHGFGVHINYLGHDLHGLRFGPDGKLYFSIGDRGTNVKDCEKPIFLPDTGCVMRCNPDGTRAGGLRPGPAQPAGIGLRRVRQPVYGGQQLRRRRQGALRLRRPERRQRLAHRLPVRTTAEGIRGPWMAEKMDDPPWAGTAGVDRAAGRQHRQRAVRPDLLPGPGPAGALRPALLFVRFPRLGRRQRHPLLRLQAEGGEF